MPTLNLFPDAQPRAPLVGIARLAAEARALDQGHEVEYLTLANRSVLARCVSSRVPFAWMINPYRGCEFACKYCYARYTHEFMELQDGMDFERRIYVKQNTAWVLRQELKGVHSGQSIAIGTATDPYQPAERKFGITRSIMEEFARHEGFTLGLVTKSDMILRDLDLLRAISAKNQLSVHVTVTTVNTDLARILEPRAPRPDLRFKAVRKLVEAGIRTGVNCAPVLPGITDDALDLESVVRAAAAAKATFVTAIPLFLKPCSAKIFLPFLQENFPHLVPLYQQRYTERAFLPVEYRRRIATLVKKYCAKHGIGVRDETRKAQGSHQRRLLPQLNLFRND
jgi:DNA repair photolyase